MLLRKQNPQTPQRSTDVSMRPQNYTLEPFVVEVRGKKLLGSKEKKVSAKSFVLNDCADDYKLESLLEAGITPQEVNRPYFTPTIDDFSSMENLLRDEEQMIISPEPTPEPTPEPINNQN